MEDYKKKFDRGTGRKRNNEYTRKQSHRQRCKNKIRKEWDGYSDAEKQEALRRLSELKREFQKIPMGDPMDENYKRIQYVRYADYTEVETMPKLSFRYRKYQRFRIKISA